MATSKSSLDPQLFHCPTCGAALPLPGDVASVRCEYCGSSVLVPAELRKSDKRDDAWREAGQPVVINLSGVSELDAAAPRRNQTAGGIIVFLVIMCVAVSAAAGILASTGVFASSSMFDRAISQVVEQVEATIPAQESVMTKIAPFLPTNTPENPGYRVLQEFGGKGNGPGQFEDSRWLAVDPDGSIFTAEFEDGRVQKFDPEGKFTALINVPPDEQEYTTISDIAADFAGHIYVARRGDILIFNASDGTPAGEIPGSFPDTWFETLVIDPANNLYAFHTSAGELDLIKMSADGNQQFRKVQVTEGLVKKSDISNVRNLAVDGLGNTYLLDTYQSQVYKFDSQANFLDRFGSKGDGPGLLENPEDLTVDGQGHIYVLNQDGIEIFDNNGVALKLIPDFYGGHAFDIQIDREGNLYIITNEPKVYKIRVDFNP